jgi:hypothetical protein
VRTMTIGDAGHHAGADQQRLARDLIEVHGNEAPTIARGNARTAALAGQPIVAKSWIRVLSIIQRQQAGEARKV